MIVENCAASAPWSFESEEAVVRPRGGDPNAAPSAREESAGAQTKKDIGLPSTSV